MITINYVNLGRKRQHTIGTSTPGFVISGCGEKRYVPGATPFVWYGTMAG